MQKNKCHSLLLLVVLVMAVACVSCTKEDLSACDVYLLTVRAYDADNKEITDTEVVKEVKIYVFDASNNYLRTQDATIGKPVELRYPGHDSLNVVVWGNSAGVHQSIPALKAGDSVEKAFLSLLTTKAALPTVQSPDDLFYGSAGLVKTKLITEQTIPLCRKTSSVTITTRQLKELVRATDDDFSYIVRKSTDKLGFDGRPAGVDVAYAPPATFNPQGELATSIFNILSTPSAVEVDIYHRNELVATVGKDSSGQPFHPVDGMLLNILIDYSGQFTVSVSLTPWGEKYIWKDF